MNRLPRPRLSPFLLAVLVLGGCIGAPLPWQPGGWPEAGGERPLFTFAIMADPHIEGEDEEAQLASCVDWLNEHRTAEGVELAFILGDFGDYLDVAYDVLSGLSVPWVPVIGDGLVEENREAEFREIFGPQMERVGRRLEAWRWTGDVPDDPRMKRAFHLHSFAFVHRGVHFLGLDWCTRKPGKLICEQADLHAFPGGTWPFFRQTLAAWNDAPDDSIVLLTHHPMHGFFWGLGSFSPREIAAVEAVTGPRAAALYANFAGHYHMNWQQVLPRAGYTVYVTDTCKDGSATIRLVRVHGTASGFTYEHRLVDARAPSGP